MSTKLSEQDISVPRGEGGSTNARGQFLFSHLYYFTFDCQWWMSEKRDDRLQKYQEGNIGGGEVVVLLSLSLISGRVSFQEALFRHEVSGCVALTEHAFFPTYCLVSPHFKKNENKRKYFWPFSRFNEPLSLRCISRWHSAAYVTFPLLCSKFSVHFAYQLGAQLSDTKARRGQ